MRVYYPSGRLKEYVPYANLEQDYRSRVATTWYDNGPLSAWQAYQGGRCHGPRLLCYESGILKRRTEHVNGNERLGSCFAANGQVIACFPYEQLPLYPGGHTQLARELNKALRLPPLPQAFAYGQPCLVDVAIQLAEEGRMRNPRVAVSSKVPELDEAVLNSTLAGCEPLRVGTFNRYGFTAEDAEGFAEEPQRAFFCEALCVFCGETMLTCQSRVKAVDKLSGRFRPEMRDGLLVRCVYHLPVQLTAPGLYTQRAQKL